jgi:putative ABC transport system permease protein
MTLGQDVRYGLRVLRKHPGFTLAAAMSLALGIGATTAIFSVTNATLLRTLPYREPARLATISLGGSISAPLAVRFRHEARSIERAALFVNWSFNLAGRGEPERIPGARVSAELFDLLGIQPRLGRAFTAAEDQLGRDRVVVISDGLWKREFGGDGGVVGRGVILNGAPYTIIGVMPPGFQFPDGPELPFFVGPFPPAEMWRPMALENWERTCGGCFNFGMIARLRRGVTPAAARAEMRGILERHAKGKTSSDSEELTVRTLEEAVTGKVRAPVLVLLGAVTLALLIACVNVANLLVARGIGRQAEIAVRLSLGATSGRVVRQLLTEALALAVCASALAVPLAWAGIRGLVVMAPAGIPGIETAGLDGRMLAFALGVGIVSAVVFGAAPAVLASRRAPGEVLKAGGRTATGAPSRLRAVLVVAECALAMVLLIGSALLAKSFLTAARTPLGFHAENVVTMKTVLPGTKYDERRRAALVEQLANNCGALAGVMSAAAVSTLPLTGESEGWGMIAEDSPNPNDWTMLRARAVTPGYFRTLGIRMRAGRDFTGSDRGENPVAIVSESGVRRMWPGVADPVGRRIKSKPPITVVGIVDDTRASGLDTEVQPYIYVPFGQFAPEEFAIAVRSAADPARLAAAVKSEIWRIDKNQPVTHVAVMKQLVADSIAPRRFQAVLMTLFGAFALVLAAVGIYGVLAYSVAQRTHEIGIRMALGASRLDVLVHVMRQAGALALAGTALGLAAAWLLTPLLRTLLYGVGAAEVSVYAGCALVLLGVAAVAGIVPARRAAGLDPAECLRHE